MSLKNGCIFYATFEGTSNDITGGGYSSATDTNITYNTSNGIINKGAGFNGTNSQIIYGNKIIPLGAKTISVWIKPNSHAAFRAICGNNLVSSSAHGTEIFGTSSGASTYQFFLGNGSGNYFNLTSPTVTDGVWNHLVCTWDGTTSANAVKFYVNAGKPTTATSSSIETVDTLTNFTVGSAVGQDYYNGALDSLGIWNRALSSTEVSQLFNVGLAKDYPFGGANFFPFFFK